MLLKRFCSTELSHINWRCICYRTERLTPECLRLFCSYNSNNAFEQLTEQQGTPSQLKRSQKKKRSPCQPILDCFDQQYSHELGRLWTSARAVLLDPHSWQYAVLLNRFTTLTDVKNTLTSQGFSSLLLQTDAFAPDCAPKASETHLPPDTASQPFCLASQSKVLFSKLPAVLQCFVHPTALRFPSQPHRPGQLKQYYLLNAASLLPVLALQVRDGDKVLDLCSAPGGKALAIMQTANPALLCCNEPDPHRRDWLVKTLESFLPQSQSSTVVVSSQDGRSFGQSEAGTYDKVLVDAPCSNDRSWLYSPSCQQGEQRLRERGGLPGLQAQLLRAALAAVRPGGIVVYSTCTLSSCENHAVVESVLSTCPEAQAEDLWEEIGVPFSNHFTFDSVHTDYKEPEDRPSWHKQYCTVSSYPHKHGILVVPQRDNTWGPMFLCRIRRKC